MWGYAFFSCRFAPSRGRAIFFRGAPRRYGYIFDLEATRRAFATYVSCSGAKRQSFTHVYFFAALRAVVMYSNMFAEASRKLQVDEQIA